ncbi:ligase-associated DNA damage response endonuclease PdeM [Arenibacter certesii]|uniref:DEAD/DEAH box helicase n=1 Tax=Arenibacter certesii TaxID=228955 RepID=A0A918MHZ7_9FLAO|nr:ligase-associated DNA damage response endonuclease PdeM [Arenibacter certesii]GGW26080.1 DEAD/DEAH box helicase [Arenibacter certesii]
MEITIGDTLFTLHPSGAVYWKDQNMLLIADVHLGKISHFRKFGSAIPQKAINTNFERLNKLVSYFNPDKICFLGDLFHSTLNNEWGLFEVWVKNQSSAIILIKGNHDIISPEKFSELGIQMERELLLNQFLLTHHPEIREGVFNISGHIHPGIKVRGVGRQSLSVPCFHKQLNQLTLPAFGAFTGKFLITPKIGDAIYATAADEVIKI